MKNCICFLFLILIFINGCSSEIKTICFENNCVFTETADSESERETGLMYRNLLLEDRGMLFIFDSEGIHEFWMKDTLIPLDIIWLNSNKEVVHIKENAQPCRNNFDEKASLKNNRCEIFANEKDAKYVLEINSGKVKELGIKMGDKVNF